MMEDGVDTEFLLAEGKGDQPIGAAPAEVAVCAVCRMVIDQLSVDHAYGNHDARRSWNVRIRRRLRQQHPKIGEAVPIEAVPFMTVRAKSKDGHTSTRTMKYSFLRGARAWQSIRRILASSSPSVAQRANQVYEKYFAKKTNVEFDPRYDKKTVNPT